MLLVVSINIILRPVLHVFNPALIIEVHVKFMRLAVHYLIPVVYDILHVVPQTLFWFGQPHKCPDVSPIYLWLKSSGHSLECLNPGSPFVYFHQVSHSDRFLSSYESTC